MKKFLTLLLFASIVAMPLRAVEVESHDNRLYFTIDKCDDLSLVPITLHLENPSIDITAIEMYLSLPEDARIFTIESTSRSKTNHQIIIGNTLNGFFVSIASENVDKFEGVDGAVCTIYCDFSALADGNYTISSSGVFAVGVTDEDVTCYTVTNQEEQFSKSDNGISGIKSIASNASNGSLEIYNLQGIRLNKLQKGQINIVNGKKVIL
jgi:hypothetical protein